MKKLEFNISYMVNGTREIERIFANSHREATTKAKSKGKDVTVTYIEKPTDLLYLH